MLVCSSSWAGQELVALTGLPCPWPGWLGHRVHLCGVLSFFWVPLAVVLKGVQATKLQQRVSFAHDSESW